MEKAVVDAWWEARSQGQRAAMMAPTNDTVVLLNQRAQQRRAEAGEIDLDGPSVAAGGYRLVAGDVVATRHNERQLHTDRGLMVKNRDQWEVLSVHPGGALTVSGSTGTVRLPAEYVAEHVELAYAQTSHANQGRTVDRSFLLLDGPADTRGVYVPMTRGRMSNEAFVVLHDEQHAVDVVAQALARDWIDEPAIARREKLAERAPSGEGREVGSLLRPAELRGLLERHHAISETLSTALSTLGERGACLSQATSCQQKLVAYLADAEARQGAAQQVIDDYDHPLRRRLHRSELERAHGTLARATAAIGEHTAELAEIEARLPGLRSALEEAQALWRSRPELERERQGVRQRLGKDLDARKDGLVADPPDYVVDLLGPRPERSTASGLWDEAAARIDQHRTAFDVADERSALGSSRPIWDRSAFASSQREAASACDRFDQALGRGRAIEAPSLELGIGL